MLYFLLRRIYILLICHFIGDYVLQTDFLAKTKAVNSYHMLIHCILYSVPFAFYFGMDWRIIAIILSHIAVDFAKCNYSDNFNYPLDQLCHLMIIGILYLIF